MSTTTKMPDGQKPQQPAERLAYLRELDRVTRMQFAVERRLMDAALRGRPGRGT